MSDRQTVLLLPLEGRLDDLSGRLLLVHYRGRLATSLPEAERLLRAERPPIRAALMTSEPKTADLSGSLHALRKASVGGALRFIAIGARPTEDGIRKLRSAGVDWALFDGFTDTELRFLLNQASAEVGQEERRDKIRVPTPLTARVKTSMGVKVALVYNLSAGGAYLETMRPSQEGAKISVELPLPSGTIELPAQVVSTNVTGNLRRENLPRGMGVKFEKMAREQESALSKYIEERAASFRP